jgi:hypothetical protein
MSEVAVMRLAKYLKRNRGLEWGLSAVDNQPFLVTDNQPATDAQEWPDVWTEEQVAVLEESNKIDPPEESTLEQDYSRDSLSWNEQKINLGSLLLELLAEKGVSVPLDADHELPHIRKSDAIQIVVYTKDEEFHKFK